MGRRLCVITLIRGNREAQIDDRGWKERGGGGLQGSESTRQDNYEGLSVGRDIDAAVSCVYFLPSHIFCLPLFRKGQ